MPGSRQRVEVRVARRRSAAAPRSARAARRCSAGATRRAAAGAHARARDRARVAEARAAENARARACRRGEVRRVERERPSALRKVRVQMTPLVSVSIASIAVSALACSCSRRSPRAHAPPRQPSGAELARAIERLGVVGSVLYVAAHPDDENTRLLAWLANERLVRTAYLSLTRGDGGQNLIGSEQAPLLGADPHAGAARGARASTAPSSSSPARATSATRRRPRRRWRIWGHDEVLADVVWAIRRFRPDVIVTRFPPERRDTHGHHTASAMLARRGVPRRRPIRKLHPEQLAVRRRRGRRKRIVWNKGVFDAQAGRGSRRLSSRWTSAATTRCSASRTARWRRAAAACTRARASASSPARGPAPEYFQLLAGEPMQQSLFDGVDSQLGARAGRARSWRDAAASARAPSSSREQPAASDPAAARGARRAARRCPTIRGRRRSARELDEVIAACAGLFARGASPPSHAAVPGGELTVTRDARSIARARAVTLRGDSPARRRRVVAVDKPLARRRAVHGRARRSTVPAEPAATRIRTGSPSRPSRGAGTVRDPALIGLPEQPPPLARRVRASRSAAQTLIADAGRSSTSGPIRSPASAIAPVEIAAAGHGQRRARRC